MCASKSAKLIEIESQAEQTFIEGHLDAGTFSSSLFPRYIVYEPETRKRYTLPCAPIEDSDQPSHLRSLIVVFNERSMGSRCPNNASFEKLKR